MRSRVRISRAERRPLAVVAGGLLAIAMFGPAFAQEGEPDVAAQVAGLASAVDTAWLLLAAALVFFMQAGFAMVEAGFVRSKNTTNILMKNVLDACVGGLFFWAFGYAIAFGVSGADSNGFMGDGNWFLNDFENYAFWFFQFAFAATAATIVSGAMAERTKFSAYLIYTAFISAIIYPFVVHWAWDVNGWMSAFNADPFMGEGYVDFAGSGVVHMVGGTAGLVGAILVGARHGRFTNGKSTPIPGHSVALGTLGMFILWFGWYGFNPGSTLGLGGPAIDGSYAQIAARVAATTTLSACAAAVTAVVVSKARTGKYDMGLVVNGILGGLVGITAGCATVEPWAAVVIGAIATLVVMAVTEVLDMLKIDDPVGAVPVHMGAGIWGVLAVGLFSSESLMTNAYGGESGSYGLLLGGGVDQFIAQLIGAGAILAWAGGLSVVCFGGIKLIMGLRVDHDEEMAGLDQGEHGINSAYPEFVTDLEIPRPVAGGPALGGSPAGGK